MTKISKIAASTLIAASLTCLTAPAFAAQKEGSGTAAQAATSMSASADAPKAGKEKKFCVVSTVTGSILPQKDCRTKADWAADGIDIEKYRK